MGSTAGNVYSTIVAVVSYSITLWILVGRPGPEFPTVEGEGQAPCLPPPAGAGAARNPADFKSTTLFDVEYLRDT